MKTATMDSASIPILAILTHLTMCLLDECVHKNHIRGTDMVISGGKDDFLMKT